MSLIDSGFECYATNGPADARAVFSFTLDGAERTKRILEDHHRNHVGVTLDWDGADPEQRISLIFTFSPSWKHNWSVRPATDASICL
jgi:hypothetical protein